MSTLPLKPTLKIISQIDNISKPKLNIISELKDVEDVEDVKIPESPFLEDVSNLNKGSHFKIKVTCQGRVSEKCIKESMKEYRNVIQTMKNNNEKYYCMYCSPSIRYSGRSNPSCLYNSLDDNFMKFIDTKEKAYLLGWIASDGSLNPHGWTVIEIHQDDFEILDILKNIICNELKIKKVWNKNMISLKICSEQICLDICNHLNINPGKKSDIVDFPQLATDELKLNFIRGYFDGDGSIQKFTVDKRKRNCSISSNSDKMLNAISNYMNIQFLYSKTNSGTNIIYTGDECIEFLNKMYHNCGILKLKRKYLIYLDYLDLVPGIGGTGNNYSAFKYVKTQASVSSLNKDINGYYPLLIYNIFEDDGKFIQYDTNIKIQLRDEYTYNFISDYNVEILNIDNKYIKTVKIKLNKNLDIKNFKLPYKIGYLNFYKNLE